MSNCQNHYAEQRSQTLKRTNGVIPFVVTESRGVFAWSPEWQRRGGGGYCPG